MPRLHLHLLSDSTGETLEMLAKAALAQFEGSEVIRHFWPMVRSQQHLDRIQEKHKKANGYIAFYRNKQVEVRADTSLEAQRLAAHYWRVKRSFDVTVVLAEIGSEPIIHTPDF